MDENEINEDDNESFGVTVAKMSATTAAKTAAIVVGLAVGSTIASHVRRLKKVNVNVEVTDDEE